MSGRHDAWDGLADDLGAETKGRGGARFLKRANALDARTQGEIEEKTLRWVDPAQCVMWAGHNRAYDLLTEERCRDLIDGIRAQGRQEFPAIVRLRRDAAHPYEVICGARRHFAVSWLRANGYTQFRYLIEVRDLSDEEAFRLADIENRDREDISDLERARDYASALGNYYGGAQKRMAERLEVSPAWLSRYLALARLPEGVIAAYADITQVKERHARALAPLMRDPPGRKVVMDEAAALAALQAERRAAGGAALDGAQVLARLTGAAKRAAGEAGPGPEIYAPGGGKGVRLRRGARSYSFEAPRAASRAEVERWMAAALDAAYPDG